MPLPYSLAASQALKTRGRCRDVSVKGRFPMRIVAPVSHPILLGLGLLLPLLTASGALGQDTCRPGNLIAGMKPFKWEDTFNTPRLTDGVASKEGGFWKSTATAHLATGGAYVTYKLKQPTRIRAALVQADNNDTYTLSASMDNKTWTTIWVAPTVSEGGMRLRLKTGLDVEAAYIRLNDHEGDGSYSVGELQVFCQQPEVWPPPLTRKDTKRSDPKEIRRKKMARGKLAVGFLGLIVFGLLLLSGARKEANHAETAVAAAVGVGTVGYALYMSIGEGGVWAAVFVAIVVGLFLHGRHRNKRPWKLWAERIALIGVATASVFAWINFTTYHGGRAVHYHDSLHYYVGSKYFKENRYQHLYHCIATAEVEDGRRHFVERRKIRKLATNELLSSAHVLEAPELCDESFSRDRWKAFRADMKFFRKAFNPASWDRLFHDHGYNATPVWNMVGSWITNSGPASDLRMARLALIDAGLYASIFLLILWAFGLRAFTLAMLVWGIGYPWAYYWTGGAFGRIPWLFMAVAAVCLLKKRRFFLGGFSLMWSLLLRVFPGALFGGLAIKIGYDLITKRRIEPHHVRLILGSLAALAILIPLSLPAADGWKAYPEFLENSMKHKSTPLTNHMGLPTLFAYHPDRIAKKMVNNRLEEPYKEWKAQRRQTLESRKYIYWATVLALFGLVGLFARKSDEEWEIAAVGALMIVAVFELTCYYYNFVILLAPLAARRQNQTIALIGMAIATQITQFTVGWFDERYTWNSLIVLVAILYILIDSIRLHRPPSVEGEHKETDGSANVAPV